MFFMLQDEGKCVFFSVQPTNEKMEFFRKVFLLFCLALFIDYATKLYVIDYWLIDDQTRQSHEKRRTKLFASESLIVDIHSTSIFVT